MAIHHAWKFALFVGLCTALLPARVNARAYNMTIQSVSAAGGKCVSAPNGQFAEGMHVLIWDCNAFLTQNLSYDDQTQELKFGSNCVEILGQGTVEDPVGVGACNGAVTQRWSMVANGENYQVLGANSLCLNISNNVIANGTPLDLAPCVPNKAVELWTLFQATDLVAAQVVAQAGSAKPGTADETSNAGGNDTPGQIASNPNGPGGDGTNPGGGGSGGGGSGSGGGSGNGSDPASTFPGPIAILIGMLNPPPYDRDNRPPRRPPSMDPSTGNMTHPPDGNMTPPAAPSTGKTTQPKDPGNGITPAAADSSSMYNLCSLSADGKLVQINITMPPPDPGAVTDTGQYCVSGGPRNGQCGTVTLDTNSKTAQICGNGVCSPPTPLSSTKPPPGYGQTLFGVPDSSPSVPCPSSTSASNDPTGGLGPPMMDVATGQPVYKPRSGGSPMASPPAPPTIMVALPVPQGRAQGTPNVCRLKTPYSTPQNVCHPKAQNPCSPPPNSSPLTLKTRPGDAGAAPALKPKTGPLTLKPLPGGTQMASAGPANPCNPKDSIPACESKPPYLPWGGHGSATITVSGGQPCGIGWHDTGATILDSMSPTSHPAHGSLTPKDKHVIIFTPAPGYKGQDSFTLSMREHNGGRNATLTVKVNVTIR